MEDLNKLLELAESHRDERSRINGRIDGLEKSLKERGYRSESHARKSLKKLVMEHKKIKKEFNDKIKSVRERYAKRLEKADR